MIHTVNLSRVSNIAVNDFLPPKVLSAVGTVVFYRHHSGQHDVKADGGRASWCLDLKRSKYTNNSQIVSVSCCDISRNLPYTGLPACTVNPFTVHAYI